VSVWSCDNEDFAYPLLTALAARTHGSSIKFDKAVDSYVSLDRYPHLQYSRFAN